MRKLASLLVLPILLLAAVGFAEPARMADPLWTLLQAKDRTDDDRKDDASRKPLELLRFLEIKPGMKVADIGAGGGYTTELLARAVAPGGVVYSQNTKAAVEKFVGDKWDKRLERPALKGVVKALREYADPLPPEAKGLDIVVNAFTYHDTIWLGVDRAKMNQAIFAALKPGGIYVILDHQAKAGNGAGDTKTLHRVESATVEAEVTQAGFQVARRGDFLKNADDAHDKTVFDPALRGQTDRFVIAFVKPAK
jgi:predicted methyltransferase